VRERSRARETPEREREREREKEEHEKDGNDKAYRECFCNFFAIIVGNTLAGEVQATRLALENFLAPRHLPHKEPAS
jgi:hypothetical protein